MAKKGTSKKEKKRLLIISTLIIVFLCALIGTIYTDWKEILKNRKKEIELTEKYNLLLNEEEKLESEITKLQDSNYLARYAKEKYMLSADGDTIIKMD